MTTNKRTFSLRLDEVTYQKIGFLATSEHRSMNNYIEYLILKHIAEVEQNSDKILPADVFKQ